MDEVAKALCSGTHFTFASPATFLMTKVSRQDGAHARSPIPMLDEEEEEAEGDNLRSSCGSHVNSEIVDRYD